jgi:hypothetical protein
VKYLRPINRKAVKLQDRIAAGAGDVFALQSPPSHIPSPRPHYPPGCSLAFSPGWEVDATGGTAGLCAPVERDLYDCYLSCYWPAQVPDHLNSYPDWASKCASATKDWRNISLVFP